MPIQVSDHGAGTRTVASHRRGSRRLRVRSAYRGTSPPSDEFEKSSQLQRPQTVSRVCEALDQQYASPRHGNPTDALEVLIYILLSNRTGPDVAQRVYEQLRKAYPRWEGLKSASTAALVALLRPAGLAKKRATQVKAILAQLYSDFGEPSLSGLVTWETAVAEAYLCGLPGVSEKVAKCVLLYGFGREVLPVDVHVHRIAKRLGWHSHRRADQSHKTLEALVPTHLRYAFHVNCVAHGRAVCRASNPRCGECTIAEWCVERVRT